MTRAPKPRRRKATCLLRWFQTGHDGARQNRASTLRLTRQPSTVDPAIPLEFEIRHACKSPQPAPSFALPALDLSIGHVQIPIAPAGRRILSRGFLPWRFSYAGPRSVWHRCHGAGIRKPSQRRQFALPSACISNRVTLFKSCQYAEVPLFSGSADAIGGQAFRRASLRATATHVARRRDRLRACQPTTREGPHELTYRNRADNRRALHGCRFQRSPGPSAKVA